eukprot:scaffold4973_cov135-Cylindrotheca_fusiformis.AAC.38
MTASSCVDDDVSASDRSTMPAFVQSHMYPYSPTLVLGHMHHHSSTVPQGPFHQGLHQSPNADVHFFVLIRQPISPFIRSLASKELLHNNQQQRWKTILSMKVWY